MAEFPTSASIAIIGQGGIVGASVAHHLIERLGEHCRSGYLVHSDRCRLTHTRQTSVTRLPTIT